MYVTAPEIIVSPHGVLLVNDVRVNGKEEVPMECDFVRVNVWLNGNSLLGGLKR